MWFNVLPITHDIANMVREKMEDITPLRRHTFCTQNLYIIDFVQKPTSEKTDTSVRHFFRPDGDYWKGVVIGEIAVSKMGDDHNVKISQ